MVFLAVRKPRNMSQSDSMIISVADCPISGMVSNGNSLNFAASL